jgi:hypothetical protein
MPRCCWEAAAAAVALKKKKRWKRKQRADLSRQRGHKKKAQQFTTGQTEKQESSLMQMNQRFKQIKYAGGRKI